MEILRRRRRGTKGVSGINFGRTSLCAASSFVKGRQRGSCSVTREFFALSADVFRRLPLPSIHPTSEPSLAPLAAPNSAVIKPVGRLAHSPAQRIIGLSPPALSPAACLSVSRLTLHFPRPTATDGPVTPAAAIAPQRPFDDRGRGWVSPPSPAPRLFRGRVRRWRSFYRFSGAIIKRRNFDTGGF